jgi:hypothetical protein
VTEHFRVAEAAAQRSGCELDDLVAGAVAERRYDAGDSVEPQADAGDLLVPLDRDDQRPDDGIAER